MYIKQLIIGLLFIYVFWKNNNDEVVSTDAVSINWNFVTKQK